MRMTTRQLKQIIKEEVDRSLNEFDLSSATGGLVDPDMEESFDGLVSFDLRVIGIKMPQTVPVKVIFMSRSFNTDAVFFKVGSMSGSLSADEFEDFKAGISVSGNFAIIPYAGSSMNKPLPYTLTRA